MNAQVDDYGLFPSYTASRKKVNLRAWLRWAPMPVVATSLRDVGGRRNRRVRAASWIVPLPDVAQRRCYS